MAGAPACQKASPEAPVPAQRASVVRGGWWGTFLALLS